MTSSRATRMNSHLRLRDWPALCRNKNERNKSVRISSEALIEHKIKLDTYIYNNLHVLNKVITEGKV